MMYDLIHKLHNVLNALKGFSAGLTSRNHESIVVGYGGKIYRFDIKEIDEAEEVDIKHLEDL